MPLYNYVAKNLQGKSIKGKADVPDIDTLLSYVKDKDQFLISYEPAVEAKSFFKLNGKELAEFNRELSAMLSAGISLLRAFEIMLRRDLKPAHRKVYEKLYTSLLSGISLSDAMEEQGKVFPQLLINMFRAGEANGTIELTASRMATHYEGEYRLAKKVKSASTYPMVLLVLTVVIMIVMFTFIVPTFADMYGDAELPKITQFVLGIKDLFTKHLLWVIITLLVAIFGVKALLSVPKVRLAWDKFKIKMPVFGKLRRTIITAQFSRTLSSLYSSGLSILSALEISKSTIDNAYVASQFDELANDVRIGGTLAGAVEKVDGFDPKLSATIMVGEESGRLDSMLISIADSFDYEANEASQRMLTILEPLLIFIMAAVIGGVIISVILPMYGSLDMMSQGYL